MNADLTDRGIKLLYRQRGSRSRHVAQVSDGSWPVIRAPEVTPEPENDDDELAGEPILQDGPLDPPLGLDPLQEPEPEPAVDAPRDDLDEYAPGYNEVEVEEDELYQYNFQNMPLRQLSSSITSITSIDVLISMLSNLFENDLIPQATREFEASQDKHSKMMYKLDVRIFESVLQQLVKDFKDILDINMSNNELCYQLKQLVMAREDLNEELVQVRKETQELKCGGEWYQLQQEQSDLNERVGLNEQLNQLTATLAGERPVPSQPAPLVTNEGVDEFCGIVNPYSGVLAQIESINVKLRQEPFT
ncbi:hypothetical protein HG536_0H03790 [Torulaspora globosa]|uniref:Inner kinetochore subunit AME1 domain-containing protein n=1 Tax=Torulaspora globosa TaxID=48254 RepID=A0A7G3ZNB7_9SACH|nr:uncharacterized protein HG536_0H03790 [Torulaspora globosa]QLL35003.1 hypothetical protein HG536_0H03790 [Torulaspora globosa]